MLPLRNMRALPPSRNRRAFPLSGGIGGFVPQSQPSGGQLGGGRTPKSLQQVLSESGFQMPEKPRYSTRDIAFLGKDPVTGRMRRGGSSDRNYYKQLDAMYAQNPEALEIAKQYEADPFQFGEKPSLTAGGLGIGQQTLVESPISPLQQNLQSRQPQFESPQQNPQPMFTQQDMSGMMRMMMQMFQQMMQGGMGQGSFNSGAFNNAPRSFYPQPYAMPQQSYAMPQQSYAPPPPRYRPAIPPPYQRRQPTNFSGSPFGGY